VEIRPNDLERPGRVPSAASRADDFSRSRAKLPPHNLEIEEAVLGAIMLEKDALAKVVDLLRPEVFYRRSHQLMYEAIIALFDDSKPIDVITVVEQLRSMGKLEEVGNAYAVSALTANVANAANIEYHAHLVVEKYIQRELINVCSGLQKKAYEDGHDVFDLLDEAEQSLYNLSGDNLRREAQSMEQLTLKTIAHLEELKDRGTGVTGISTGYEHLDELTSGWQKSDFVIIAARPAMGKTAFVLSVAKNAAKDQGKPVLFFSLEMSATQLAQRLIVSEAMLNAQKVRTGNLENYEWEQLTTKISDLSKSPLYIDDTPGLSINDLRSKCRRMKSEKGISMVIIDYLQLMSGGVKTNSREQEIAKISRSLKMLAKELDLPVIALSQLNRSTEVRGGDKRPMLSDLRESGSIEQDADMVMFLYRPEYYDQLVDEEGNSTEGICEVIIGKQRNGPVDTVKLQFHKQYGRFEDNNSSPSYGQGFSYEQSGFDTGNLLPSRMNEAQEDDFNAPDIPF